MTTSILDPTPGSSQRPSQMELPAGWHRTESMRQPGVCYLTGAARVQLVVRRRGQPGKQWYKLLHTYALSDRGHRFRPDRQIHVNRDPVRPSPAAAAICEKIRMWGRHFDFMGESRGIWIYRHNGMMGDEWAYAALAVLDVVPCVPSWPMAIPVLSSFDPIDPPASFAPLFRDSPWWAGREFLADILLTLPHWGYTRVRWVTADAHTPPEIARDKTVLYFQGPDLPTVVAQIFWEPQLPYPPFGVSTQAQPRPVPVVPKRLRIIPQVRDLG